MNSLTITLCVLIKTTVILSIQRLPATTTINPEKLAQFYPVITYEPKPYEPKPLDHSSKSLYSYKYNTDTGIQVQEDGYFNNAGTDQETLEVRGSYSYTDNDGNTFQVSYIANENGFQPEGVHLPTVPSLIKKALQYNAEHPEENEE